MNFSGHISKKFYIISGILILGIFIFAIGIKAWFFQPGGEAYYFGEITQITESGFIIKGREYAEKTITINNDTVVRKKMKIAKEELRSGAFVIVVGLPTANGQIEARLVRILNEDDFRKYR